MCDVFGARRVLEHLVLHSPAAVAIYGQPKPEDVVAWNSRQRAVIDLYFTGLLQLLEQARLTPRSLVNFRNYRSYFCATMQLLCKFPPCLSNKGGRRLIRTTGDGR